MEGQVRKDCVLCSTLLTCITTYQRSVRTIAASD